MSSLVKLLYPGMHIKRWLLLLGLGVTFMSLGVAYLMTQAYRTQPFPEFVWHLTLQFIDRPIRGVLFLGLGAVVSALALLQLSRSVLAPFLTGGRDNIVDIIHQHRYRNRGPRIVVVGGGTGLSTMLRGLKEYASNVTAVVSVADDGGSSGRIRRELGVLPPGDIRQCLVAMADVEPLMTKLFQYRFEVGSGLEGHNFGNLFIAAMTGITGNFERAIRESSRVLAVRGSIMPSTLENVVLCAEFDDQVTLAGESAIREASKPIQRLFLQPSRPSAYPEAIRAILEADLVVIGPGSLYTSVMPNLLVEDIARAVRASQAVKVYVCNVATERGETDEFAVGDHIRVLEKHVGPGLVQYVLANSNFDVVLPPQSKSRLVGLSGDDQVLSAYNVVMSDVVDVSNPIRHDSKKLSQSVLRVYYDRSHQESQRRRNSANVAKQAGL